MNQAVNRIIPKSSAPSASHEPQASSASQWSEYAKRWMIEHPAWALGAATVVGAALGWIIKRK